MWRFNAYREKLHSTIDTFTNTERMVFFSFFWIFIIGMIFILWQINNSFLVEIPARGGRITEGIIGTPRFINPVLAISQADRDLTTLVYSGLMRVSQNGDLINDLASTYTISDDGLIYTFTLKEDVVFHDGEKVTADDVVFTVEKIQDTTIKSPRRASWDGVLVEKISDTQVRFTLSQPYVPFLQNTTLGILPKYIWDGVPAEQFGFSEFNVQPVGSGPYKIKNIERDRSGIPQEYELVSFDRFALGEPFIENVRVKLYANEEKLIKALESGEIDNANAISPKIARQMEEFGYKIEQTTLPRIFGIFFNQNEASIFTDTALRKALSVAINKEVLVEQVLSGYGSVIDGPIPPGSFGYIGTVKSKEQTSPDEGATTTPTRIEKARKILSRNGWEQNESGLWEKETKDETLTLSFSISTSDVSELTKAAEIIKDQWSKLGADVEIKIFEVNDLNQNVIRPRKYDALLFGEIIGKDSDLFAFWHSSQRNDPGLNIASYTNITVDKLLEETRTTFDKGERAEKYKELQEEISNDIPAVFLYAPEFVYILSPNIQGVTLNNVTTSSDRLFNINKWFIETDKVWPIFAK